MATEDTHAQAVIALLSTLEANPFELSDVTATNLPTSYTEVYVSRRFTGPQRMSGRTVAEGYRITLRAVGRDYVENARNMRSNAAAIEGQTLTVDGLVSTPIQFETADLIGPDGDRTGSWFSGVTSFTYLV